MSAWNDERVEMLTTLWKDGLSASQIARRIGGVTRNAVIGKRIRLGLPDRGPSRRNASNHVRRSGTAVAKRAHALDRAFGGLPDGSDLRRKTSTESPAPLPAGPDLITPPDQRVALDDLAEAACRWPYGDGPFAFCGKPKVMGKPYCEGHCMRAFEPLALRRRRADGAVRPTQPAATLVRPSDSEAAASSARLSARGPHEGNGADGRGRPDAPAHVSRTTMTQDA